MSVVHFALQFALFNFVICCSCAYTCITAAGSPTFLSACVAILLNANCKSLPPRAAPFLSRRDRNRLQHSLHGNTTRPRVAGRFVRNSSNKGNDPPSNFILKNSPHRSKSSHTRQQSTNCASQNPPQSTNFPWVQRPRRGCDHQRVQTICYPSAKFQKFPQTAP